MNRSIKFKRYHFDSEKKLIAVTQWGKITKSFRIYEDSELSFTSPSSIGNQIGNSSYAGLEHWKDCISIIGNIHENPELIKRMK